MAIIMNNARQSRPKAVSAPAPIVGKVNFRAIDDFRVGNRQVILCGVAFTKGAAMRELATEAARKEFHGKPVNCRPVGSGTPCDGRAAATFKNVPVAQCITEDGRDIAAELSTRQILCDFPAHSGGYYTACR
jgi:hypothetical protein